MTFRRAAVALGALTALVVAGCGSDDPLPGSTVSDTARPPCGGSAPACGPTQPSSSPTGSPAPTTAPPPTPGDAATFARYARKVFNTKLGDPGVLNVCKIAVSANTAFTKITVAPPKATTAGSCSFDLGGSGVPEGSSAVVSVLQAGPYVDPKPKTVKVSGLPVLRYPYEAATGDCKRALVLTQPGVVTTANFSAYAKGLAATRTCALGDAVIARFVAVAAGAAPKTPLDVADPSLLSIDACKVAAAANLGTLPDFAGAKPDPTDFSLGCELDGSARDFTISPGVLRDASSTPEGTFDTVDGHPLYEDLDATGSCTVTSAQAGGETVTISTSAAQPPSVPTCDAMATALGEYLHVLGLC